MNKVRPQSVLIETRKLMRYRTPQVTGNRAGIKFGKVDGGGIERRDLGWMGMMGRNRDLEVAL